MGRIEEIKERWSPFKGHDVNYLISRLQIAEETIQRLRKIAAESIEAKYYVSNYVLMVKIADQALEQIQKE